MGHYYIRTPYSLQILISLQSFSFISEVSWNLSFHKVCILGHNPGFKKVYFSSSTEMLKEYHTTPCLSDLPESGKASMWTVFIIHAYSLMQVPTANHFIIHSSSTIPLPNAMMMHASSWYTPKAWLIKQYGNIYHPHNQLQYLIFS